jgi:hypothetical protein
MFTSPMSRFAGQDHGREDMRNNPKHRSEGSPDHVDSGSPFTHQFRVQAHDDGHYSVGEGDDYEGDTHYEDLQGAFNHISSANQPSDEFGGGESDENMAFNSKGKGSKTSVK